MSNAPTPAPAAAFVREAGTGPAVLCLHSNASTSGQWRGLMDTLSPQRRVLAPDLLGAGRSAAWPVATGARLAHEAAALAPLLGSLSGSLPAGAGERFAIVGHSYGAALALHLALAHPGRVSALVLYEPTLFPLLHQQQADHPAAAGIADAVATAGAAVARGDLQAAGEAFIDYWMGAGAWAAMPEPRRGPVAESMRPVWLWAEALFAEPWSLPALDTLTMPVLLLGGSTSPPSVTELLPLLAQALPHATLQVLPGLGHMAPVTHPGVVNPRVVDFLLHAA